MLSKAERIKEKQRENLEWKLTRKFSDANPRYSSYYRAQLPDIFVHWEAMQATLARDLPVTFRVCNREPLISLCIQSRLKKEVSFFFNYY
jgi:hypothetical protein